MLITYEEYAANSKYPCIKRSTLEQVAAEQGIDIMDLIMQASNEGITVVRWA